MRYLSIPALIALLACPPALAEVHEIRMLNRGAAGSMVYEPDFVRVAPGDTVRFLPTQSGHNAASIPGLLPEGAEAFKSKINQPFELTLEQPGFYGVQCTPHAAMGMVMLIQVGEPTPRTPTLPAGLAPRADERLKTIFLRELSAR